MSIFCENTDIYWHFLCEIGLSIRKELPRIEPDPTVPCLLSIAHFTSSERWLSKKCAADRGKLCCRVRSRHKASTKTGPCRRAHCRRIDKDVPLHIAETCRYWRRWNVAHRPCWWKRGSVRKDKTCSNQSELDPVYRVKLLNSVNF